MLAAIERLEVAAFKFTRSKNEVELQRNLTKFFRRMENEVIRELERTGSGINAVSPLKGNLDDLDALILDITMREAEGLPSAQEMLKEGTFRASQSTMNRMSGEVMDIITEGYADGVGVDEIATRLRPAFRDMSDWELRRIARTETHHANNVTSYEKRKQAGIRYHKWITGGENIRSSHANQHGMIVKVGDPWPNGQKYPGDRSVAIVNWVNCKCQAVTFLMPAGKTAPPGKQWFTESDLIDVADVQTSMAKMEGSAAGMPPGTPPQEYPPWKASRLKSTNRTGMERELVKRGLPEDLMTQLERKELRQFLSDPSKTDDLLRLFGDKYGVPIGEPGIAVPEGALARSPWKASRIRSTSRAQAQKELVKRGLPEDLVLQMERKEMLAILENPRATKELMDAAARKYKWRPGVRPPTTVVSKPAPTPPTLEEIAARRPPGVTKHERLVDEAIGKTTVRRRATVSKETVKRWYDEMSDRILENVVPYMRKVWIGEKGSGSTLGTFWSSQRKLVCRELTDWSKYRTWTAARREQMYREVFHHEYGHAVDHAFNISGYFKYGRHEARVWANASNEIKALRREVQSSYLKQKKAVDDVLVREVFPGQEPELALAFKRTRGWYWDLPVKGDTPYISRYSNHDIAEFWAESVADYVSGGSNLKRLFPKLYDKIKDTVFDGKEFTGGGVIKR